MASGAESNGLATDEKRQPDAPALERVVSTSTKRDRDSSTPPKTTNEKEKEKEKAALPIDPVSGKPITPVGIFELFRYHTNLELFLNAIALVCAAGSGAAQVSILQAVGHVWRFTRCLP